MLNLHITGVSSNTNTRRVRRNFIPAINFHGATTLLEGRCLVASFYGNGPRQIDGDSASFVEPQYDMYGNPIGIPYQENYGNSTSSVTEQSAASNNDLFGNQFQNSASVSNTLVSPPPSGQSALPTIQVVVAHKLNDKIVANDPQDIDQGRNQGNDTTADSGYNMYTRQYQAIPYTLVAAPNATLQGEIVNISFDASYQFTTDNAFANGITLNLASTFFNANWDPNTGFTGVNLQTGATFNSKPTPNGTASLTVQTQVIIPNNVTTLPVNVTYDSSLSDSFQEGSITADPATYTDMASFNWDFSLSPM